MPLEKPWQCDRLASCLRIKNARPIVSGSAFGFESRPPAKAHLIHPSLRQVLLNHHEVMAEGPASDVHVMNEAYCTASNNRKTEKFIGYCYYWPRIFL